MKLTQLAVLLSGAALSASVLAADPYFSEAKPQFTDTKVGVAPVQFGDENNTSWLTPQSKPMVSGNGVAGADRAGLPNDLDENALAYGNASHGAAKRIFARLDKGSSGE